MWNFIKLFFLRTKEKDAWTRRKVIQVLSVIGYESDPFPDKDVDPIFSTYAGNVVEVHVKGSVITLICLRPGAVIGRGGKNIDWVKQQIELRIGVPVTLNIEQDLFWFPLMNKKQ